MKKLFMVFYFSLNVSFLYAQQVLTIEGITINNTETGTWNGVDIPRDVPTIFTFRNNAITSVNFNNYMLRAGDEGVGSSNNNLDGAVITGNQFTWNGTDMTSICHGIFTGHNINVVAKYNYLNKVPMGIIRKSNGMTDVSGVVGYNIIKSPNVGIVIKGMNGVKIYNNTFYQERTTSQTNRGLIDLYKNTDIVPNGSATGTKIFNNIFYTKHQTYNIIIYNNECLSGFESDYNVFWCEDGSPMFKVAGELKTFSQWQALGYDLHSVVINPDFTDKTNFIPAARLDYGKDLGTTWRTGLSTDANWGTTDPDTTNQNGTWQVGSRIYGVSNINQPPSIQNQGFQLNENSPVGTFVGTVIANDPDPGQLLTYSIISGDADNALAIDSSSGAITVANPSVLNYEVITTINLTVKVQDNGTGKLSKQAIVSIHLVDINETPVISNQALEVNVNSANGTIVGTVIAADPDAGQSLTYSILPGYTNNPFAINPSAGTITVANNSTPGYKADTSFAFVVKVQDNGTGNLSSEATITVTLLEANDPPVISNQTFSVNENSTNETFVGTVIATEPDAGQRLTYSILSGNINNTFAINSSDGAIVVANSQNLDYEVVTSFTLAVKVQDNGAGKLSSQAIISIALIDINELPLISNQDFSINVNFANGTIVGSVIATDPDAGQELTYAIVSGDTNNAFAINAASGAIAVANNAAPGYKADTSFIVIVKVKDNGIGNLSSEANITINLIGANELPIISNQIFWINENSANETVVGAVIASDPDTTQSLTYEILSGNKNNAFKINTSTGELAVANYTALNYEADTSFALALKVQDNGAGRLSNQAIITVALLNINEPPLFNNQAFTVFENSAIGTVVGTVKASDPDAGQALTYAILSGNMNNAFTINASSGVIFIANSAALNYEADSSFTLTVKTQDNGTGQLSSQAEVMVALKNMNEPPIITNQAFSVNENSANGIVVGSVIASDPDSGQAITYTILSGNTNSAFTINASSGVIAVTNSAALNYEIDTSYVLTVNVADNGTGTLNSQAKIIVNVIDTNEPPVISNQAFFVNENSVNGTVVGSVIASDPDTGQAITYSILSGNTNYAFTINASSGVIAVINSAALNYEIDTSYVLTVNVADNGTGTLNSQAKIIVNVIDINEPPIISNQGFAVNENSAVGTIAGVVIATDPDKGQTKNFSILSGNMYNAFEINPLTGALTVANSDALNYEVISSFTLAINIQDNGTDNLNSLAIVTITVNDLNEPPIISNQAFSINEKSAIGTIVGTIIAEDPDAGQTRIFSILSGNLNNAFEIIPSNGAIVVANSEALNCEVITSFALAVNVQDNGTGALSSTATVQVNLNRINRYPVIANQYFVVNEFASKRIVVGTVVASDPDEGQLLSYSIKAGNTDRAFSINLSGGSITVNNKLALNYNTNPVFHLIIAVRDNGTGQLDSDAIITINIINSNSGSMPGDINTLQDTFPVSSPDSSRALGVSRYRFPYADPGNDTAISERIPDIENPAFNQPISAERYINIPRLQQTPVQLKTTSLAGVNKKNLGMRVYPNPVTSGKLNIKLDEGFQENFDLLILDLSGKSLLKQHFEQTNPVSLDLSSYPPALYLIQIQTSDCRLSDKFIIR